ncbi:MAG: T9SS type A sorting domain-containing protein [Bacteroidetes bacterium]|jgi:photosystem II stability/assembly factor-like uncharacterized protein|nr:T9SS type A sorting domain-containing protein [Bacteroidota bacterium]
MKEVLRKIKKIGWIIPLLIAGWLLWMLQSVKKQEEADKPGYDKPGSYARYFHNISTPLNQSDHTYEPNYRYQAYRNLKKSKFKSTHALDWTSRGPSNVSGRTRAILVDPDDPTHNTWYAGSASGGIWKTTDGGQSWQHLTEDLPNLATSTLAMSPANTNVIYAGTGEGFGGVGMVAGAGIFKSTDKGESWSRLPSTAGDENFEFVNRLLVHPLNEQLILAATNTGIFRSENGGDSWDTTFYQDYMVQDITASPFNFNLQFAGARYLGVLKSTDGGKTWERVNKGLTYGFRHEVATSPIDSNIVFTSVEAPNLQTHIYMSDNQGDTWYRFEDEGGGNNFLGNQGWFNNIIESHPYNKEILYVGGVNLGRVSFTGAESQSDAQVLRADTFNTGSFLSFVNFGGQFLGGGLLVSNEDNSEDLEENDWRSVEIRFGNGLSQKAHRFTVPEGEGPSVPDDDYTYQDYVDVPFEVWDTDNNQQLMVSFRDQGRDGKFNLEEIDTDDILSGREYLYVHGMAYAETASPDITKKAGHLYKQLYFIWPVLTEDATWEPDNLPAESILSITYGTYNIKKGVSLVIADSKKNDHLHVDHHELIMIKTDEANKQFTILDANDGGLGLSKDNGVTWKQITNGYNTTQFYGVSKMPGEDIYIGGMQDNGTWRTDFSRAGADEYEFMVEGDGFETVWHAEKKDWIIASSYNNYLSVSTNRGESWKITNSGINNDGPFVTRIAYSPDDPDVLYVAGNRGVYKHYNFGVGKFPWYLTEIADSAWTINRNASSQHVIAVSKANKNVIWAGSGMNDDPELRIFVSKNGGESFKKTAMVDEPEMGFLTNLATHPTNPAAAYALFSISEKPKIYRTNDYGESWTDITQFGDADTSENDFPDVMVYDLLVLPNDTNTLWAGTEIGIIESTDNGATWHKGEVGLPAVSIWQMQIIDNQLVVATHGRGIWTADYTVTDIQVPQANTTITAKIFPNPATDQFTLEIDGQLKAEAKVQIYNNTGKLMFEKYINPGNTKINIPVNHLPAGMYNVIVRSGKKQVQLKLLKQ